MKLDDFVVGAVRTESVVPNFDFEGKMLNSRLVHSALGLATEAGEVLDVLKKTLFYGKHLDVSNLREEISDLMWYVAILCDAMNWDMENLAFRGLVKADLTTMLVFKTDQSNFEGRLLFSGKDVFVAAGEFLDAVLSGAEEESLQMTIIEVLAAMGILLHFLESSFEEEAQRNHDKLKTRYSEKFTSERALSRNIEAEKIAMEDEE